MARDRQVTAIGDGLRARIADVAKALTLEVTANLVEDCPVDTGHVRANFVPNVGSPFAGEAADSGSQQAGQAAVLSYKLGDGNIHITNNVGYLAYLILGSSQQAPAGWDLAAVDRAVATVQAQNDDVEIRSVGYDVIIAPGGAKP